MNISKTIALTGLILLTACTGTQQYHKIKPQHHAYTAQEREDERYLLATHVVHFDFNSAVLSKESLATLDKARDDIRSLKPREILVTGYADTSGDKTYNRRLAERRAGVVVASLKERGVSEARIKMGALGEDDSAVPTLDEVRFLENRRVAIDLRR